MQKTPYMKRRRGCATFTRVYLKSIFNDEEISLNIDSSKSKKQFDNDEIETLKKMKECIDSSKGIQLALNQKINSEYSMQNTDADDNLKDDQKKAAIKNIISCTKLFESMNIDKSDVLSSENYTINEISDTEDSNGFLLADPDDDVFPLYNYDLEQNSNFYDNDICLFEI